MPTVAAYLRDVETLPTNCTSRSRGPFSVYSATHHIGTAARKPTHQSEAAVGHARPAFDDIEHGSIQGRVDQPYGSVQAKDGSQMNTHDTMLGSTPDSKSLSLLLDPQARYSDFAHEVNFGAVLIPALGDTLFADASNHVEVDSCQPATCHDTVAPLNPEQELAGQLRYSLQHLCRLSFDERVQLPQTPLNTNKMPDLQKELVHHWVTILSSEMVAADGLDNMSRTVWVPMALAGLRSNAGTSDASRSLFHGICSAAAHHLHYLRNRQGRYLTVALHHNQLALHYLRHHLSTSQNVKVSLTLMAILACIVVEAISGRQREWRSHLWGGLHILRNILCDDDIFCPYLPKLLQIFLSLAAVCGLDIPQPMRTFLISFLPVDDGYLLHRHGIPQNILRLLLHANSMPLSQQRLHRPELDQIELQLNLRDPSVREIWRSRATTKSEDVARAFSFASLAYIRRNRGECTDGEIQILVRSTIDCLEAAESAGGRGSVMMWPITVIAAECRDLVLQQRIRSLLSEKEKIGFGHIKVLAEFITACWRLDGTETPYTGGRNSSELLDFAAFDVPPL
ncbi:hypothetical protein ACCO45_012672 [Purpureocillium lilacinum]|uniref:Uncharacterized protein n=1 Tax=Purpureocillium lilacinum TaxID=33203 RepID=A0ACC4D8R1_PURLI